MSPGGRASAIAPQFDAVVQHHDLAVVVRNGLFEDAEWKALMMFTTQNPVPPTKPPSLREAIRRVASLAAPGPQG